MGYNYDMNYLKSLDMSVYDINSISRNAFIKNPTSSFYACNIGKAGKNSFAQKWVNKVGGSTMAFNGKTDYENVADQSLWAKIIRKIYRLFYNVNGFGGNPNLPIACDGVDAVYFVEECGMDD